MRIIWRSGKSESEKAKTELVDVLVAEVKGATLNVWSLDVGHGYWHVWWLVIRPQGQLHATGKILCHKKYKKETYRLAKKLAKRFSQVSLAYKE